jgi:hypothetical protein
MLPQHPTLLELRRKETQGKRDACPGEGWYDCAHDREGIRPESLEFAEHACSVPRRGVLLGGGRGRALSYLETKIQHPLFAGEKNDGANLALVAAPIQRFV